MSYILDALKKAEQERKLGRTPDLMDNHGNAPQSPKKRALVYALLVVLILIAGGLGWWFGHDEPSNNKLPFQASGIQPEPAVQPHKMEYQPPAQAAPVEQKSITSKVEPIKEIKPPAKPEARKRPEKAPAEPGAKGGQHGDATENRPNPGKIYTIDELPDDIRKGLPAFVISTHMYSQERSERLVSINGNIGREGQEIMPGITLVSVLPDGAILKHKGYKIRAGLR
jgi:general secretion pathway protein B